MVMVDQKMPFQVGDQVIHWVYGPGEIIELDEKTLSGHADHYYVVKIRDLTFFKQTNKVKDRKSVV